MCVDICMHIHAYAHVGGSVRAWVCPRMHVGVCTHVGMYMHVCRYVYVCGYVHVCIPMLCLCCWWVRGCCMCENTEARPGRSGRKHFICRTSLAGLGLRVCGGSGSAAESVADSGASLASPTVHASPCWRILDLAGLSFREDVSPAKRAKVCPLIWRTGENIQGWVISAGPGPLGTDRAWPFCSPSSLRPPPKQIWTFQDVTESEKA